MHTVILRRLMPIVLLTCLVVVDVAAQRRQPRTNPTRRRPATAVAPQQQDQVVNPATGNAVNVPAPTTPDSNLNLTSRRPDNIFGDSARKSLRIDNAVEKNLIKDRTPLPYDYIREDDAIWGKRIWREINIMEKMNLPFRYAAQGDEGDERLITILISAIRKGEVTAFSPIDDRFTTPMTVQEVMNSLQGDTATVPVIDPVTGKETLRTVRNDFNPDDVATFRLKEDWVFDKESSTLVVRILGIAPLKLIKNQDGSVRGQTPLFWLYYPDLRPVLARHEVYNPKNFTYRMSWEDLFEMRFFSSYITKEDNAFDRTIKDYIPGTDTLSGVRRLLEAESIKEKIFNWEQDLWSY